MEPGSGRVTETPRLGSRVASPSETRIASASRMVGRETPERLGQGDLAQRRAGLELAVEDRPAQLVGDPVDGRGVLEAQRAERLGHGGPPRWTACRGRGSLFPTSCAPSRVPPHWHLSDCLTIKQFESRTASDEGGDNAMGNALAWGKNYVMVRPDHFRVDYRINPFMDLADQPDPVRAREQWDALVATIRSLGGTVDALAAARGRARHGLRDEPRPRRRARGQRRRRLRARRDVAHALRRAPDGDRHLAAVVRRERPRPRRTSVATASAPTSRPATRSRSVTPWSSATARAPRSSASSTWPATSASGCAASGSPTPACTTWTSRSARSTRPRAIVCPAAFDDESAAALMELVPDAHRAHRGGGADHVRRQLDRHRPHRRDAGLPRPRAPRSSRTGASRS